MGGDKSKEPTKAPRWIWGAVSVALAFVLGLVVALLPRGRKKAVLASLRAEREAGKLDAVREALAVKLEAHEAEMAAREAERERIRLERDEAKALQEATDAINRRE